MNHRRFARALPALLLVLLVGLLAGPSPRVAAQTTSRYTMTAFTNSSESNMYVYESLNAANYSLLRGPAFTPPSGLIRDPSVLKHTDGRYYVVYTTNWTGNTIGFASSSDRVNWTFFQNITLPVPSTGSTWAPEWFKDSDGSIHIIVSLSQNGTGGPFQPYKITALNSALTSWSAASPLSGLAPNYIDTFLVKIGGTYHAFTKNETTKYIEYATATSLTGPYTFVGTGNWAGWGNWLEGPALVQLDGGAWRIYFDAYTTSKYYSSDSANGFQSWTARAELPGLSGFVRHLTVLKEQVASVALPTNVSRSLQSYNYPDRSIRHRNSLGYAEAVGASSPLATRQDATFRIVQGLASASCYSFESVNVPGSFLRHYGYRMRLDPNNNTAQFRADATFCARPGLADSGAVSFESYNYPNRYIRHRNSELWVDPFESASLYRSDATFRVISAWQ
ncbi:MAG TPA: glycoside hydrolase family 43 protein [Roseiflexaceae bacterium]|nr:glycoside hydrolase family 43 protein [Roseiflexaceae bacterium]